MTSRLRRSGVILEGITLGWNVVGIVVLAIAAIAARSVALGGFGLDSLIEIGASTVVLWELLGTGKERQRKALRIIGAGFILLAVYLAVQSTYVLATGHHPKHSVLGIVWTAVTAAVMFGLAAGKARVGRALDNPVLRTEGRVTMVDAFLATAVPRPGSQRRARLVVGRPARRLRHPVLRPQGRPGRAPPRLIDGRDDQVKRAGHPPHAGSGSPVRYAARRLSSQATLSSSPPGRFRASHSERCRSMSSSSRAANARAAVRVPTRAFRHHRRRARARRRPSAP